MSAAPANAAPRGDLRFEEPMSRHTSWRVGGPATRYYEPADIDDLAAFLQGLPPHEPLTFIGLGSNLLVRDGGLRGTVISLSGRLNGLELQPDGTVRAEAGVACNKLARYCVRHALAGAEFLGGIPGTVGGALAMNAGCHGSETWQFVAAVETLDRNGRRRERSPQDFRIAYRQVRGPVDEWFVAGRFRFAPDAKRAGQGLLRRLLARRGATQPTQLPNAGSVFKNPPNDFAARLIEACGLKGTCEGGACVSEQHANFIVNSGGASAADIERLIARVQREIAARHGVQLEIEVRIVGEAA